MVKPLLTVWNPNEVPPVISHPVEAAGEVVELLSGGFAVSAVGQIVQQLGKAQQAAGDLPHRIGRNVADFGLDGQGRYQQHTAAGHGGQLRRELLQCGRAKFQEDECHGVPQVPLGRELAAPPENQEKRHGKVQQGAQPDIQSCRKGQQAQQQGDQVHGQVVAKAIGFLAAQLE